MINMEHLSAIILGGTGITIVFVYVLEVLLLGTKATNGNLKSDSRGIKNLKFQRWNSTWWKFVMRK